MNPFDKLFKRFPSRFPKTTELLMQARGDVFPEFALGLAIPTQDASASAYEKIVFTSPGCSEDSLYDLASLTKVICTTSLYATLEEANKISIEEKLNQFFPSFNDERVKLSHLLDHSSGFPAWLDLHSLFHEPNGRGTFKPRETPRFARTRYETEILKSFVPEDFEKKVTYSDLGFMLLGWAAEKKLKTPIDALFQEYVSVPLGLDSIQFLPTTPNVLPTEDCPWRGRVLRGEVHDDNCYVLGGVAAHAGLFGNVKDVLKFGLAWLESFADSKKTFIVPSTAKKYFTNNHIQGSVRSLGWDGVSKENSSTGHLFSPYSRGHLGFTGTSLWIDPEKRIVVTLLTNRVHPTRANEKIKTFRPLFHDTLLKELFKN